MKKEYTNEELWEIFDKIPAELKYLIFAEETEKNILDICNKYGIKEEETPTVRMYVERVLMGILPPNEFRETLEKELGLEKEAAKGIAIDTEKDIFYPVKAELENLYKIEIAPPARPTGITPPPQEKPPTASKTDVYREPVE